MSVGIKHSFCEAAGLKEREAQKNRIAHAAPDCHNDVGFRGDILHQHRVDCHADDNEKRLKAQGKQGAQLILTHAAPFLAHHGSHRNRCY